MNKIYIALLFTCFTLISNAQVPNFEWAKHMGGTNRDTGRGIATDTDGNTYTTGYFIGISDYDPGPGEVNLNAHNLYHIFIQKLDADGNLLWVKQIGGVDGHSQGFAITVDTNGNVYVTGSFNGLVDFDPGSGEANLTASGTDIFVLKLDTNGNYLWAKRMGGGSWDDGFAITTDTSGNVYTTGSFVGMVDFDPNAGVANLHSAGDSDIFIQKLDTNGNFLWAKGMGSTSSDKGFSITTDNAGNVLTTGYFVLTVDFDPGAGTANLTSSTNEVFIQKLDTDGNFIWAKKMGGNNNEFGYAITTDTNNNIYTTGFFEGTADFDPNAGVANLTAVGNSDIFIQKLDANGNFQWAKQMGGSDIEDVGFAIVTDQNANVYTTGTFRGTVDFDPGTNVAALTSTGATDIFIQSLDTNGNYRWAINMGDIHPDTGRAIAIHNNSNIYTSGSFFGTVDFDPSANVENLTQAGGYDVFIQKLGINSLSVNDYVLGTAYNLYPNPTSGQFTIVFASMQSDIEISVSDVLGRQLCASQYKHTDSVNIEINHPAGVYYIKIKTPQGKKTIPVVKK